MGKLVDDLEMTRSPRARRCVALIGRLRWRSGAPGQSAALPFHKAHQANGRSLFGHIVDATPSLVGPPVHAFRLVGELLKHVRASAQPHPDLLRFPKPPPIGRFLLASVYKPIAVAAGEQSPDAVQLGNAATAIHSICSNRTHKPGPLS